MSRKMMLLSMLLVASCAAHGPPTWYAADADDKFRNEHGCRMSIVSEDVGGMHYSFSGNLYPFVQKVGDEVLFGVTSVALPGTGTTTFRPSVPLPTGDVELKIDNNPTIVLAYADTRIREVPGSSSATINAQMQQQIQSMMQANPALAASLASVPQNISKMTLPYTTVIGDKAKQVIEEMRVGKTIAFRQIAPAGVLRSWEYPLTGFPDQLKRCGI